MCTEWVGFTLDPAQFPVSGLQQVTFRTIVDEPDGNTMINTMNWQLLGEGDLEREEGVARVLGQLGGGHIRRMERDPRFEERRIDRSHQVVAPLVACADEDPVRAERILRRSPFSQKLRVRHTEKR